MKYIYSADGKTCAPVWFVRIGVVVLFVPFMAYVIGTTMWRELRSALYHTYLEVRIECSAIRRQLNSAEDKR